MKPAQKFKKGAAIAALLTCAACAPVNFLNAITPSGSYGLSNDIAYGDHARQKLDVYTANSDTGEKPLIVFIHGGSWNSGDKNIYKFLGQGFTQEGYSVIIPNYRLYPEARFPDFMTDGAEAVKWVDQAYPDRDIILIGHSAGAHTALNIALNDVYLMQVGLDRCTKLAGVVGLAGPYGSCLLYTSDAADE